MTASERTSGGGGALLLIVIGGPVVLFTMVSAPLTAIESAPARQPVAPAVLAPRAQAPARTESQRDVAVQTGVHAQERHGIDADRVRDHFATHYAGNDQFWNRPPCKDGRHRFISYIGYSPERGHEWALWVLEQVGPGEFREITAFTSQDQDYIKKVSDDCGLGGWHGHAYGGS